MERAVLGALGMSCALRSPPPPPSSLPSSFTALPAPCTTLLPPMLTLSISSLMLLSVWGRKAGMEVRGGRAGTDC